MNHHSIQTVIFIDLSGGIEGTLVVALYCYLGKSDNSSIISTGFIDTLFSRTLQESGQIFDWATEEVSY